MAPKELHFFGEDLKFGTGFYRRDLRSYMGEYAAWNGQSHGGEASVWYLFSTQAAREIHEFNPEAKIIIMLREPAEVIHSLYHQFRFDANEHLSTLEEALTAQEDRRQGKRICRTTYFVQGLVYGDVVRYTDQVRRYFEVFGRDRVHVVIYDDFSADVEKEYQSTLDFLGLDSQDGPTTFRPINERKLIRSRALRAVLCDPCIRSLAVRASKAMGRNTFLTMRRFEQTLWKINSHAQDRLPMAADLRAGLKRQFGPEIERLSDLLHRDLTYWNR